MFNWNRSVWWLMAAACAAFVFAGTAVVADDAAAGDEPTAEAPSAAEIDVLIGQLDADSFAERQAASDKLGAIGKPAIEALVKAAAGDSLEVIVRAIDLLKDLMDSSDTATEESAKSALEEVAKSDRPAAARRAADALRAAAAKRAPAVRGLPAGIQLGVAGARRINVRTVNGVKTIEAEEADRKVKITEDPNDGIKMEVTSQKDGKDVTDRYEAKDAEELKKQHPNAYEIYTKYNQMGGAGAIAMQLQIGNLQVQPAVPFQQPNLIDTAARMLPAWWRSLERMATEDAIRGASKESKEELKKQVGEVKEQLEQLEKRLQEAIEKADELPKEPLPGAER